MRSRVSSLLLALSVAGASSAWAAEVVILPGGPVRLGVAACPEHVVLVGLEVTQLA